MYGILTYIYHTLQINQMWGRYTIHGSYGYQYPPVSLIFAMSGVGYWRTPGTSCHWQTADGAQWSLRRRDGDWVCVLNTLEENYHLMACLWPQKAPKGCQIKKRNPKNTQMTGTENKRIDKGHDWNNEMWRMPCQERNLSFVICHCHVAVPFFYSNDKLNHKEIWSRNFLPGAMHHQC